MICLVIEGPFPEYDCDFSVIVMRWTGYRTSTPLKFLVNMFTKNASVPYFDHYCLKVTTNLRTRELVNQFKNWSDLNSNG